MQPKYIHNILKSAERRKLEKERRSERKVQSEREAEAGMYDDKESFVTASYLKKMEELKKIEAENRVEAIIEGKFKAPRVYFCDRFVIGIVLHICSHQKSTIQFIMCDASYVTTCK